MRISIYFEDKQHIIEVSEVCRDGLTLVLSGTKYGDLIVETGNKDTVADLYSCLVVKGYCFFDDDCVVRRVQNKTPLLSSIFKITPDMFKEYVDQYHQLSAKSIRKLCEDSPSIARCLVFEDYDTACEIGRVNFDSALMSMYHTQNGAVPTKHYVTMIKRTWNAIDEKLHDDMVAFLPELHANCSEGKFSILSDYRSSTLAGLVYLGGK